MEPLLCSNKEEVGRRGGGGGGGGGGEGEEEGSRLTPTPAQLAGAAALRRLKGSE